MNERDAVIVGAGLGGPVLAMWLQKVGIRAEVFEARESVALAEGAFLGVAPNGMNVLAELGLADQVRAIGHACTSFEFLNARGQRIGVIDRSEDEAAFGQSLTMVRRGELHALIAAEASRRGIELHYGAKLTALREAPNHVTSTFSDGRELTSSFVVGCDGLRSTTRALVLPQAPEPTFTGMLDFGGFARVEGLPFPSGVNVMVFGTRAFFGAFTTPGGETWWFHNGPPDVPMLELHRDDPGWISQLIRATPQVLGPWRMHELQAMPRWSSGRVALLGDAAHAMSPSAGQGASLAFEDAMVLARCLRDEADVARAFTTFERTRRPRVDAIFKAAQRNSSGKMPTRVQGWFRDRLLPWFLKLGAKAQHEAYAFRVEWP